MKKFSGLLLMVIIILSIFSTNVFAENKTMAKVSQDTIKLNNKTIYCEGFKISGVNYYKLRDIAEALSDTSSRFDVKWNDKESIIEIVTGKEYTLVKESNDKYYNPDRNYYATATTSKILVDGKVQNIKAFNIDGNNYFKLRDLEKLIPFDIKWDSTKNEIKILPQLPKNAYRAKSAYEIHEDNHLTANFARWKNQLSSYIVDNNDGTKSVIETNSLDKEKGINDIITIDIYDKQYNLIDSKKIDFELPLFGGFYSGKEYNYIVFGQENIEENDNKEVIRIVKYDKDYNRIGNASVKGGESFTIKPFDAGSGKMAEYGDILVLHTARTRYTTDDGLNHQSQLTVMVDTPTMTTLNYMGEFQDNHVSHSFDQYVLFDGNNPVFVDHGDAYPRSVVLTKGDTNEKSNTYKKNPQIDLFKIPGEIGANCTGVSIGGFEMSSKNYIVAMNTINHSLVEEYTSFDMIGLEYDQRDIIVCTSPRLDTEHGETRHIIHGKYIGSNKNASVPQLVKITDNRLVIMWQEYSKDYKHMNLKYALIDENGEMIGNIQEVKDFILSECKPIISDNNIIWYTNKDGERIIYKIPLD
jgi:hypothetical protein